MVDIVRITNTAEVTIKFDKLRKGIQNAEPLMGEIGNFLVSDILIRTAKGRDVEGLPFQPYSESYKKVRDDRDLPTDRVDLFFTGQMTSALTYEEAKTKVKVFFMNTPRRGTPKKGGGFSYTNASNAEIAFYNNEVRKFFAISPKERKYIKRLVKDYFKNLLKKR